MLPLRRCLLYVPSSSARMLAKSSAVPADSLVYDLEDSVPCAKKAEARSNLAAHLRTPSHTTPRRPERLVRVNDLGTSFAADDLNFALSHEHVDGIVLPKVETAEHIRYLSDAIARNPATGESPQRRKRSILACIESPRAVVNLREICEAGGKRGYLDGLIFAAEDYAASSGVTRTPSLTEVLFARQSLVTHAKAYGLSAIDLVCVALRPDSQPGKEGPSLLDECREGRRFGFTGKQAIHPDQVATIQEVFGPDRKRVAWARRVVEASERNAEEGIGAFVVDGKVVDQPVIKEAKRILGEAEKAGM